MTIQKVGAIVGHIGKEMIQNLKEGGRGKYWNLECHFGVCFSIVFSLFTTLELQSYHLVILTSPCIFRAFRPEPDSLLLPSHKSINGLIN